MTLKRKALCPAFLIAATLMVGCSYEPLEARPHEVVVSRLRVAVGSGYLQQGQMMNYDSEAHAIDMIQIPSRTVVQSIPCINLPAWIDDEKIKVEHHRLHFGSDVKVRFSDVDGLFDVSDADERAREAVYNARSNQFLDMKGRMERMCNDQARFSTARIPYIPPPAP